MIKALSLALALSFIITLACDHGQGKGNDHHGPGKNEMAGINRYLVQKDRERIENYIERKGLKMTESATGLWYHIKNEGRGKFFTDNDKITMEYNCSLLDGTPCYSSVELGPREVTLGATAMEAGLYQGLRMLKPGGEALFILPPYLGRGLPGDGNKIPSRAIIVYSVKIFD
jgi:FKBP-type peptidyl-prolyl cis-trans isomerase